MNGASYEHEEVTSDKTARKSYMQDHNLPSQFPIHTQFDLIFCTCHYMILAATTGPHRRH